MTSVVIGDLHGYNSWEKIVQHNPDADQFIFLGDYFDSKELSVNDINNNFDKIIKFKELNPNKVHLLLGNHDYHYLHFTDSTYSGYNKQQDLIKDKLLSLIENNILYPVYNEKGTSIVYSHAGITKTWLKNVCINKDDIYELSIEINNLIKISPALFDFVWEDFSTSLYGDNVYQSPIWVRPNSLVEDSVDDAIQIVGHTSPVGKSICNITAGTSSVWLCDCLVNGYYLRITNDENTGSTAFLIKNINLNN